MKVLVLGATGTIGAPVVDELSRHGHDVIALARSEVSARELARKNIEVLRGDIRVPETWIGQVLPRLDAVVHSAATFSDDMGKVDGDLVTAFFEATRKVDRRIRFVYTGGCWLFGETGDRVADETMPLSPIPAFAWMEENWGTFAKDRGVDAMLVHPAMVYDRDNGAVSRFIETAVSGSSIEVWGSRDTRWPAVHRRDLAVAYRLVLEQGIPFESYCVAAEPGVRVGDIADALARRYGDAIKVTVREKDSVIREEGDWALGPMLDQQMSGRKIRDTLGWKPRFNNIINVIR